MSTHRQSVARALDNSNEVRSLALMAAWILPGCTASIPSSTWRADAPPESLDGWSAQVGVAYQHTDQSGPNDINDDVVVELRAGRDIGRTAGHASIVDLGWTSPNTDTGESILSLAWSAMPSDGNGLAWRIGLGALVGSDAFDDEPAIDLSVAYCAVPGANFIGLFPTLRYVHSLDGAERYYAMVGFGVHLRTMPFEP